MSLTSMMNIATTGMATQTARLAAVADHIANPGAQYDAAPETDSANEVMDMIDARTAYAANAAVLETGADLWEVLALVKRD